MTKSLIDLVTELQEDVPAVGGVPSDTQYERAIKDAVRDFSRRCGVMKTSSISVVSGTASYALPSDFLSKVAFNNLYDEIDKVMIVPGGGLIAFDVTSPLEETITIQNKTLTIYPTPTYTTTRYVDYKAEWILDESENYTLTEDEAQIVLLYAKKVCFEKLGNASAGGFKYTMGNMSVDISSESSDYSKRQYELHGEYVQACKDYNGAALC